MIKVAMNRIFFVHIPRTGGTTIETIMRKSLPGIFSGTYSDHGILLRPREAEKSNYFVGHNFYYVRKLLSPVFAFTFLRDPVERAYSLWAYMHENRMDLVENYDGFLDCVRRSKHFQNHQVRFLAANCDPLLIRERLLSNRSHRRLIRRELRSLRRLDINERHLDRAKKVLGELDFVGVFDHFEQEVVELFKRWDITIELPLPREKTSSVDKRKLANIDSDGIEELKEKNMLDQQLYEYALALYNERQ